jgi:hypothetical protein
MCGAPGGGVALDATGIGAVAGVPVGVVSTAAVVQGSSAVLIGGAHLMKAASDAAGGGRNAQKSNVDRADAAKDNLTNAKSELAAAKRLPPSKERSEKIRRAEKQIKHQQRKAAEKSETHSRKPKGQQQ